MDYRCRTQPSSVPGRIPGRGRGYWNVAGPMGLPSLRASEAASPMGQQADPRSRSLLLQLASSPAAPPVGEPERGPAAKGTFGPSITKPSVKGEFGAGRQQLNNQHTLVQCNLISPDLFYENNYKCM